MGGHGQEMLTLAKRPADGSQEALLLWDDRYLVCGRAVRGDLLAISFVDS
jgi:hypothetical protein